MLFLGRIKKLSLFDLSSFYKLIFSTIINNSKDKIICSYFNLLCFFVISLNVIFDVFNGKLIRNV